MAVVGQKKRKKAGFLSKTFKYVLVFVIMFWLVRSAPLQFSPSGVHPVNQLALTGSPVIPPTMIIPTVTFNNNPVGINSSGYPLDQSLLDYVRKNGGGLGVKLFFKNPVDQGVAWLTQLHGDSSNRPWRLFMTFEGKTYTVAHGVLQDPNEIDNIKPVLSGCGIMELLNGECLKAVNDQLARTESPDSSRQNGFPPYDSWIDIGGWMGMLQMAAVRGEAVTMMLEVVIPIPSPHYWIVNKVKNGDYTTKYCPSSLTTCFDFDWQPTWYVGVELAVFAGGFQPDLPDRAYSSVFPYFNYNWDTNVNINQERSFTQSQQFGTDADPSYSTFVYVFGTAYEPPADSAYCISTTNCNQPSDWQNQVQRSFTLYIDSKQAATFTLVSMGDVQPAQYESFAFKRLDIDPNTFAGGVHTVTLTASTGDYWKLELWLMKRTVFPFAPLDIIAQLGVYWDMLVSFFSIGQTYYVVGTAAAITVIVVIIGKRMGWF